MTAGWCYWKSPRRVICRRWKISAVCRQHSSLTTARFTINIKLSCARCEKVKANNRLLLCSLLAVCLLFVLGCSGRGTYSDSLDPRAAKVRFIAYAENATLDYYDADHCEGKTTGLLNNWFFTHSRRRVDMRVAPPANASAY